MPSGEIPKPPRPDRAEILRALRAILEPGQVTELRALDVSDASYRRPHTVSGYFDDIDKLASAAASIRARGVYFIPNPVNRDLLARASNRARVADQRMATTSDAEIVARRWLLVDFDAVRPADISADDAEHDAAFDLAARVAWELSGVVFGRINGPIPEARGQAGADWPPPLMADSGNGYHLLWRVDLPAIPGGKAGPEDLLRRVLAGLAARFDTDAVKIDRVVYNPARIWKLYGTVAAKGDHTESRPHRLARLWADPLPMLKPLMLEQLEAVALPAEQRPATAGQASSGTRRTGGGARATHGGATHGELSAAERARLYLEKVPGAISGSGGHTQTFVAACALVVGFGLALDEARPLLQEYNGRCQPPWSEKELEHKLSEAAKAAAREPDQVGRLLNAERPWKPPAWTGSRETEFIGPDDVPIAPAPEGGGPQARTAEPSPLSPAEAAGAPAGQAVDGGILTSSGGGAEPGAKNAVEAGKRTRKRKPETAPNSGTTTGVLEAAERWLDADLPERLKAAAKLEGSGRDGEVRAIFEQLVETLKHLDAITQERVKDLVCEALKVSKRSYDRAIKDARRRLGGGWVTDTTWPARADAFIAHLGARRAIRRWKAEWYEWTAPTKPRGGEHRGGCYARHDEEWMDVQLGIWLRARGLDYGAKDLVDFKKALLPLTLVDSEAWPPVWLDQERPGAWISFRNGIVNLEQPEKLEAHTPALFTLVSLQCEYDREATCPLWLAALDRWQPKREIEAEWFKQTPEYCRAEERLTVEGQETTKYYSTESQTILMHWAGYIFEPHNDHQVFLCNWGEGNDGKSVYAAVLRGLLGERNVSGVGMEAFDQRNRFGLQPVLGKALNIMADVNEMERLQEGTLKAITGDDAITIDRKNLPAVTERLRCKFVLNCNQLPPFRDRSEGIWRRFLLVRWDNPIQEGKEDRSLTKKLKAELSGIFNWAYAGWVGVRESGFPRGGILRATVGAARVVIHKELAWMEEEIGFEVKLDEAGEPLEEPRHVYKDHVIEAYVEYCARNNEKKSMYGTNLIDNLRKFLRRKWPREYAALKRYASSVDKDGWRGRDTDRTRSYFLRGIVLLRKPDLGAKEELKPGQLSLGEAAG